MTGFKKPDQQAWDKGLMLLTGVLFCAWLILMPVDAVRLQWSQVPVWLQVVGAMVLLGLCALFFLTCWENSYLSPVVRIQEERGQVVTSFVMDAWNTSSGEAYAAQFAEDGDLIGFDGTHVKGRQEIAPFHQRLFDTYLEGTRLVGQVMSVRFLSPDVALMRAVGGTVMRGKSAPSPAPLASVNCGEGCS